MSDPATEVGADGQTSDAPTEGTAVTGSGTDVALKLESGSQSAVAAPAAAAGSAGGLTDTPDPAVGAETAVETGDGVKTEPPEAAGAGGADAPPAEGAEQARPAADGPEEAEAGGAEAPAEGTEETRPAADGPEEAEAGGAEAPAEGTEQARPAADGPEEAGADGDRAAPERQEQQPADTVPQLVKVVHSARSVFRQRDVKEYDPFTAHLERRITKLFEALDTEQTGRVDVHELGTLVRSVGCCPSETELQELVTQLEEEGQPGFIRLATVMPHIIQCVEDRKYPSASSEQLLQAFQVLADDCAAQEEARAGPKREKKEEDADTLPQDKLVHILTEEGEHFSQEEVEEMLSVVPASDTARVQYREFVKQLVVPELW